ncbi:MAG TPA: hypothetical protein VIK55_01220 [Paludibacter sp.]
MGTISKIKKTSVKTHSVSKNKRTGLSNVLTITEEDNIRTGIKKYGRDAFNVARSKGVAVTVLEGINICKISPDGVKTVLTQISKSGVKATRRSFKIE